MPCDALSYQFVAAELNTILSGGRIEKINMPEYDEIYMLIRAGRANHTLVLSAGLYPRVHLTKGAKENPLTAPSFCMCLRKNIGGGIIKSVTAEPFERALYFDIAYKNELGIREDKRLICEIMGKYSNIILTNETRIIESIKHIPLDVSAKRQILPGLKYEVPYQDKLSPTDYPAIAALNFEGDAAGIVLKNVKGLAPVSISEAIFNATTKSGDSSAIATALGELFTKPLAPCVLESDDEKNNKNGDFFIRPYNSIAGNYVYFDTLSEAMDYYYHKRDQKSRLNSKAKSLSTIVKNAHKRAEKRLAEFYGKLATSEGFEDERIMGDLLTASLYKIKSGMTALTTDNYYTGGEITIPLDPTLSPAQNAQKYYKRYAKKKRTLQAAEEQAQKTEADKAAYEEILFALENLTSPIELVDIADEMAQQGLIKPVKKQKNQKLSAPHTTIIDGFTVQIGKNNIQNDRLVKDSAKTDIWLHVRLTHGSHTVIRAENRPVPQEVILKAAGHAAYYSKAQNADKTEVDYTLIKHVSKPSGAAAGKVVYTNQKTLIVTPAAIE